MTAVVELPDPDLMQTLDVPDATVARMASALGTEHPKAAARLWDAVIDCRIERGTARSYDAACEAVVSRNVRLKREATNCW